MSSHQTFGDTRYIDRTTNQGKAVAVLTSGGDAPGMNAAVRACVRMALFLGCKAYFIHEGYDGMVKGGEYIVEALWYSVSSIIHRGGTIIGSSRCAEFRERPGRLRAAHNLITHNITYLLVIGGDGSLTGANTFRNEWSSLVDELYDAKEITAEQKSKCSILNIVGVVGSIDNDFCGTDMTIGTDSALHRITNAVDALTYTANSHQRTFILEVMGRNCGYLSIVAGMACEADYIFIPEDPPGNDWPQQLCDKLVQSRKTGKRLNIVIMSEGAIDQNGEPINAEMVKKVIVERTNQDTRVTVLGHIQRGGNSSAFDRMIGCRMGAEAVLTLLEATPESTPVVISLEGNQIIRLPLMECVGLTSAVNKALKDKNWSLAVQLRGPSFQNNLGAYKMLARGQPSQVPDKKGHTLAVLHIGAPAGGMNAAVRSFVCNSICQGYTIYGIQEGIEGLVAGAFKLLNWSDVIGWTSQGGANLGSKRTLPDGKFDKIAERLKEFGIEGLLFIGGFEAYHACGQIYDQRENYPEFCIPMVVIPATMSNNVPGSEYSLGCDTSLNEVTEICDRIRQSAQGTMRRVFIIEIMGGYCGYLTTVAGLTSGADAAYIFEEKFSIKDLQQDVYHLASKITDGIHRGLVLRSEKASENYNADFIHRLFSEEGKGIFSCRVNILGHMQQGGTPSPFDRNFGTKLAMKCASWFSEQFERNGGKVSPDDSESACLAGIWKRQYRFTPLTDLIAETNFDYRIPVNQWWLKLRPLLRILAKHESVYEEEGIYVNTVDECTLTPDGLRELKKTTPS